MYDMAVFSIFYGLLVTLMKNGLYLVFQLQNDNGKIQLLIESSTVTVFMKKFDYGITEN